MMFCNVTIISAMNYYSALMLLVGHQNRHLACKRSCTQECAGGL